MHVKAKKIAFGGLLLALTMVCLLLSSILEMNTLFFLAAASFFVGIILRETDLKTGAAFYLAGVLLGAILAPNKFYVISYAAMALYILAVEFAWHQLGKLSGRGKRRIYFWIIKFAVFNLLYLPMVIFFQKLLFSRSLPLPALAAILAAGQLGLVLYDKAYEYFQGHIWNKLRGRIF